LTGVGGQLAKLSVERKILVGNRNARVEQVVSQLPEQVSLVVNRCVPLVQSQKPSMVSVIQHVQEGMFQLFVRGKSSRNLQRFRT
jgi:hypothetical protein